MSSSPDEKNKTKEERKEREEGTCCEITSLNSWGGLGSRVSRISECVNNPASKYYEVPVLWVKTQKTLICFFLILDLRKRGKCIKYWSGTRVTVFGEASRPINSSWEVEWGGHTSLGRKAEEEEEETKTKTHAKLKLACVQTCLKNFFCQT